MKKCLTLALLYSEASGCLVKNPACSYANKFGFSYLCSHPDHSKFNAVTTCVLSKSEAQELYEELRIKRRDEFLAYQDETVRNIFIA